MRKLLPVIIVSGVMLSFLTILTLFEFDDKEILYSLVSVVMFVFGGIILKVFSPQQKFKKFFKFYPVRFRDIPIIFWLSVTLIAGGFLLNLLSMTLFEMMGLEMFSSFNQLSNDNFLISVLTVAVMPAIFEEIYFRGAVLSSLTEINNITAVIVSSLVFVIMHGISGFFISTFLAGIIFAILALVTKSITATIIAHFLNNIMSYILYIYSNKLNMVGMDMFVIYGLLFLFLIGLYKSLSVLSKKYKEKYEASVSVLNEGERIWEKRKGR